MKSGTEFVTGDTPNSGWRDPDIKLSPEELRHLAEHKAGYTNPGYQGPQPDTGPRLLSNATSAERKNFPMCEGLLDYFPDALAEVSNVSKRGNDKHNPGQAIHWARGKSMDHANCILRHLMERGSLDKEGIRHTTELAWRALALLQEELEDAYGLKAPRGAKDA